MESNERLMEDLRAQALEAERGKPDFVFGWGSPKASIMIVGEAPGAEEVAQGKPFVGPAGHLLDEVLSRAGIDRNSVWVTNVVKHRPIRIEAGRVSNRPPSTVEIKADSAWLDKELATLRPRVIVALGNVAASALIHKDFKMNADHGRWFAGPDGSKRMATFHPAYVLRQVGAVRRRVSQEMVEDLVEAKRVLESPETLGGDVAELGGSSRPQLSQ